MHFVMVKIALPGIQEKKVLKLILLFFDENKNRDNIQRQNLISNLYSILNSLQNLLPVRDEEEKKRQKYINFYLPFFLTDYQKNVTSCGKISPIKINGIGPNPIENPITIATMFIDARIACDSFIAYANNIWHMHIIYPDANNNGLLPTRYEC